MKKLNVICIQYDVKLKQVKENIETISKIMDSNKSKLTNTDLIIFPEMALTGYHFENKTDIDEFVDHTDDSNYNNGLTYQYCSAIAKNYNSYVIIGFPEKVVSKENESNVRFLEEDNYSPIRLHIEYLKSDGLDSLSSDNLSKIKTSIDASVFMYQELLKVIPIASLLKISTCRNIIIPDNIINVGVSADIVIFVNIDSSMEGLIEAWSYTCGLDNYMKRPIAGVLNISSKLDFGKINWEKYLTGLIFHELTHILVFSSELYQYYWDNTLKKTKPISDIILEDQIINGKRRKLIKTPRVINETQKHFNCTNVIGLELENQDEDSYGSHWESRLMLGDYMISTSYDDLAISRITLALFEDSGWYQVNYYTGDLFRFGRNQGCEFLNEKCIYNKKSSFGSNFCDVNGKTQCLAGGKYKGACVIKDNIQIPDIYYQYFGNSSTGGYPYTDYCPVPSGFNYDGMFYGGSCISGKENILNVGIYESISEDSGCFISSLFESNINQTSQVIKSIQQPVCYQYSCNIKTLSVEITVNKKLINCPTQGGIMILDGFSGQIECPSYDNYCFTSSKCYDIMDCIKKKAITQNNELLRLTTISGNDMLNSNSSKAEILRRIKTILVFVSIILIF